MVIRNDTRRSAHKWKWDTFERLRIAFEAAADGACPTSQAFEPAYDDIKASVDVHGGRMSTSEVACKAVTDLILDGELNVQRVNSDVEVAPLLDVETAELKLRTRANVFIGGSLLDGDITIPSLIAFFYGRNLGAHASRHGAAALADVRRERPARRETSPIPGLHVDRRLPVLASDSRFTNSSRCCARRRARRAPSRAGMNRRHACRMHPGCAILRCGRSRWQGRTARRRAAMATASAPARGGAERGFSRR